MPNETALQWLMSLGVGGVLAGGMFWVYRKDAQASQAHQTILTERLMTLADKLTTVTAGVQATLATHTTLLGRIDGVLQRIDVVLNARERDGAR